MKTFTLLLLSTLLWSYSPAQITFEEHILAENQYGYDTLTADLDDDGDLDLIISKSPGEIDWYRNTDGLGNFSEPIPIGAGSKIFTEDLDGDGDLDVLARDSYNIIWFENTDGQGNFGTQQIITTNAFVTDSVYAEDLDGDGDIDVIAVNGYIDPFNLGSVHWYENDGAENFSNGIIIGSNAFAQNVEAADIDGDGDMDICIANGSNWISHSVRWYENTDGMGTFQFVSIISAELGSDVKIKMTDLDGDGDPDVLVLPFGNQMIWYENTDGLGTYSTSHVFGEGYMNDLHVNDLDSDGDMDVITSLHDSSPFGGIVWYENTDGLGTFGSQQSVTTGSGPYGPICSGDLDGDTDIDVVGVINGQDRFAWYENNLILGNTEFASSQFSIFPNPATDQFTIQLDAASELERINIYNNLGQLVHSTSQMTVDTSALSSGLYYVEVITNKGKATEKLILK
jgi:hypothetical protein